MNWYELLFYKYIKGAQGQSKLRIMTPVFKGGTEEILPSALMNGVVDLGSLDWNYVTSWGSGNVFSSAQGLTGAKTVGFSEVSNIFCSRYKTVSRNDNYSNYTTGSISMNDQGLLQIRDSSYSSASAFKSAMSGVLVYYEKTDSTPATSPIIADIRYPDALRTDQTFLCRESPTQESGNARLRRIKGNTLVFNQLVNNGNFASTSGWTTSKTTLTVSDNVGTIKITEVGTATYHNSIATSLNIPKGHKILVTCDYMPKHTHPCYIFLLNNAGNPWGSVDATANVWNKISVVIESSSLSVDAYSLQFSCNAQSQYGYVLNDEDKIKNIQLIDLTLLNSSYITDYNSFKSYFPLSYYSYNQGTLLPFKGTGIKTTGANLIDYATIEQGSLDYEQGTPYLIDTRVRTPFIYLEQGSYTVTSYMNGYDVVIYMYNSDETFDRNGSITNWQTTPKTFTMAYDGYVRVAFRKTDNSIIRPSEITSERMYNNNTESTTNLPTSTYFPNGMKSAGTVYDELLPNKAITRIGAVDLGSLTWALNDATNHIFEATITDMNPMANYQNNFNFASSIYTPSVLGKADMPNLSVRQASNNSNHIFLKNTSYTDATTFKSAMSGVYLYYELATETETPITTEDTNEALSLLMGKSVSSNNAKQMIDIITKGE